LEAFLGDGLTVLTIFLGDGNSQFASSNGVSGFMVVVTDTQSWSVSSSPIRTPGLCFQSPGDSGRSAVLGCGVMWEVGGITEREAVFVDSGYEVGDFFVCGVEDFRWSDSSRAWLKLRLEEVDEVCVVLGAKCF
jgi:hypothetical protein